VIIPNGKPNYRAVGIIIEVPGKKRIFTSFSHITSITTSQIIVSGLLNMRRFNKRKIEALAYQELLDLKVEVKNSKTAWIIEDLSIIRRGTNWVVHKFFLREPSKMFKKGATKFFEINEIIFPSTAQHLTSDSLLEMMEDLKPADLADVLLDMESSRQKQIAKDLDNETLADVLEEMPEEDQISILDDFEEERVADVLDEMEPDDAADLLGKMDLHRANELLEKMSPEEAEDIRILLSYPKDSAGGLMTTNPVVLPGDATVALALSRISRQELSPSLASLVFVCAQPLEPPTGKLLGVLHFQQLLRNPPHRTLNEIVDHDYHFCNPDDTIDKIAVVFATYDAFIVPVLDKEQRLLGAISIDDVIDHMLPENWREED
jgi:CBS domain-containing protein